MDILGYKGSVSLNMAEGTSPANIVIEFSAKTKLNRDGLATHVGETISAQLDIISGLKDLKAENKKMIEQIADLGKRLLEADVKLNEERAKKAAKREAPKPITVKKPIKPKFS